MAVSHKKIVEVYAKKACNVSATCNALGMSRTQFYRLKNKSEHLAQMLEDAEEAMIDNVESKLLSKINDGDTTALIFFLKTKAKARGYVEKSEVRNTHEVLEPVQIVLPHNGRD